MSDAASSNVIGVRDVYDLISSMDGKIDQKLQALDSKVDSRLDKTDEKVDHLTSRMDRSEGRQEAVVSMVRWLGPAGVVGIIFGLGKAAGYW